MESRQQIDAEELEDLDDYRVAYRGEPVTGEVIVRDGQGRPYELISYSGGIQEGVTRRFHPDGQVASEVWFEAGVQEGTGRTWYGDGRLRWEGRFRGGRIVAERAWTEDGRPVDHPTDEDRP
jgi:antitoxin component YwqK of YwqJK toxin-antitoxin module